MSHTITPHLWCMIAEEVGNPMSLCICAENSTETPVYYNFLHNEFARSFNQRPDQMDRNLCIDPDKPVIEKVQKIYQSQLQDLEFPEGSISPH